MSTALFLLLVFFVVFFLVPAIRVGFFVHRIKKQSNSIFEQMFRQQAGRQPEPEPAPVKRKKIDPNVGEYVDFQEIEVSVKETSTTDGSVETFEAESQIVDVEWEDLPEK